MTNFRSPLPTPHYPLSTNHCPLPPNHCPLPTPRPAVFFDRDGVLNVDVNYLYRVEDFAWIPGAQAAIKQYNNKGYFVFVVTNQSGVARGYYGEDDVNTLHNWMQTELAKIGAQIDDFFYCPHHPAGTVEPYTVACQCRKPQPGLLQAACDKWPVDKEQSLLIGDKLSDIEAAAAAGIRGCLFPGGNLLDFVRTLDGQTN